jgi:hypothetical protein
VIGTVPLGAWETITFVAALRHNKMTAPMVVEGAMTGEMFLAYIEQCLSRSDRRSLVSWDRLVQGHAAGASVAAPACSRPSVPQD